MGEGGVTAGDMAREGIQNILSPRKTVFPLSMDMVICIQMEDCWMNKQEQQCLFGGGGGCGRGGRDLIRDQRREIYFLFL